MSKEDRIDFYNLEDLLTQEEKDFRDRVRQFVDEECSTLPSFNAVFGFSPRIQHCKHKSSILGLKTGDIFKAIFPLKPCVSFQDCHY
jgi:hypothetical protein